VSNYQFNSSFAVLCRIAFVLMKVSRGEFHGLKMQTVNCPFHDKSFTIVCQETTPACGETKDNDSDVESIL